MLTKTQIEAICKELEIDLPIYLPGAVKSWIVRSEYTDYLLHHKEVFDRPTLFTFLLLVLAAEGVPYDC